MAGVVRGRAPVGAGECRNDVADARGIAITRIERCGSRPDGGKVSLEPAQVDDLRPDLVVAALNEVGHDPAWRLACVTHAEHLANLGKCQADRLSRSDETETVNRVVGVHAIPGPGALRFGQQAELLVVPDGGWGEAAATGHFSDAHCRMLPLDIQVGFKV